MEDEGSTGGSRARRSAVHRRALGKGEDGQDRARRLRAEWALRQDLGPFGARLYSAAFEGYKGSATLRCFAAAVVADEREFRLRILRRYGAAIALAVVVRVGFDPYEPLPIDLVSQPCADWLSAVAAEPDSTTISGFDMLVEQRVFA